LFTTKPKSAMKPTLRISPTLLNEYASFINGDYEKWGKTQADFKEYVVGIRTPNVHFSRGTAVHSIMEGVELAENGQVYEPELDVTWQFTPDVIHNIRQYASTFDGAGHEIPLLEWIETPQADVAMHMRLDCLDALTLHEFKTSSKEKRYSDYYTSLQWRCYLNALSDVDVVQYHIIQLPHADPAKVLDKVKIYSYEYRREADNKERIMQYLTPLVKWVLEDADMRFRLLVDFTRMKADMSAIVQDVIDGQMNPAEARTKLSDIAGEYEQLHPHLRKCMREIHGA